MKINEFRFIEKNENFIEKKFVNWSRCYEWGYVLSIINNLENKTIHNTCAGPGEIHKSFHDELNKTNNKIYNSDIFETNVNKNFTNFFKYNILEKNKQKYDLVLCISTLEEIDQNHLEDGFNNLLNQVNKHGRLIITCDYPGANIEKLESIIGLKCKDSNNRLNGLNSVHKQPEYSHLNVILIDITK